VGYLRGFVKDDHNTWRALVEHSTFPYKGFCQALPSKSITQLELITLRQLIDVCVQADRGTHIWFTPIHAQSFSFPLGTPRNASYYSAPNPILDNASLLPLNIGVVLVNSASAFIGLGNKFECSFHRHLTVVLNSKKSNRCFFQAELSTIRLG
jgi:hypothetical protein